MIRFTIGAVRAVCRLFFRIPIETKESDQVHSSRKILLDYDKAAEDSRAQVTKLEARIARLRASIAEEEKANVKTKRSFDWARFDNNTLLVAMKDDLHHAEVELLTQAANLESNETNAEMHRRRIARLTASLAKRKEVVKQQEAESEKERQATSQTWSTQGVEYDAMSGRIDLVADGPAVRGPRERPSSMGSLVSA